MAPANSSKPFCMEERVRWARVGISCERFGFAFHHLSFAGVQVHSSHGFEELFTLPSRCLPNRSNRRSFSCIGRVWLEHPRNRTSLPKPKQKIQHPKPSKPCRFVLNLREVCLILHPPDQHVALREKRSCPKRKNGICLKSTVMSCCGFWIAYGSFVLA